MTLMQREFSRKQVKTVLINRILNTLDTSAVLSRAALFVGTSLHGALVTLAFGGRIVSYSLSGMKKNRAVLAVIGCDASITHNTSRLPDAIHESLSAPPERYADAIGRARNELGVFFDEVCDVIWAQGGSAPARPMDLTVSSGAVRCPGLEGDLARVKELSDRYRKTIPLLRRCAACLIRNNRAASECCDRLRHWATVKRRRTKRYVL